MDQYLEICRKILNEGIEKCPTRRNTDGKIEVVDGSVKTIGLPNVVFSHNLQDGFPLLTCRKMPFKSMCIELEGFIKGITSKKWYQERGCKFWDSWSNPSLVPPELSWAEKKEFMAKEDDLGPIYGYQWRKFGENYTFDNYGIQEWNSLTEDLLAYPENMDGLEHGFDQLADIVDKLIDSPDDRRMVCLAWNPNQFHLMALPPCHTQWSVTVYGGKLNLMWTQRSADLPLGVPNNIASYALLAHLLAYTASLDVGNLTGVFVDCHIYENQIEGVEELVKREPKKLPNIMFTNNSGQLKKAFSIFDWTYQDVNLLDYNPHPPIKFGQIVV